MYALRQWSGKTQASAGWIPPRGTSRGRDKVTHSFKEIQGDPEVTFSLRIYSFKKKKNTKPEPIPSIFCREDYAQGLLLALCSEIIPGGLRGPYKVPGNNLVQILTRKVP